MSDKYKKNEYYMEEGSRSVEKRSTSEENGLIASMLEIIKENRKIKEDWEEKTRHENESIA